MVLKTALLSVSGRYYIVITITKRYQSPADIIRFTVMCRMPIFHIVWKHVKDLIDPSRSSLEKMLTESKRICYCIYPCNLYVFAAMGNVRSEECSYQSVSRYWINSSHNSYLQAGSFVAAFELNL